MTQYYDQLVFTNCSLLSGRTFSCWCKQCRNEVRKLQINTNQPILHVSIETIIYTNKDRELPPDLYIFLNLRNDIVSRRRPILLIKISNPTKHRYQAASYRYPHERTRRTTYSQKQNVKFIPYANHINCQEGKQQNACIENLTRELLRITQYKIIGNQPCTKTNKTHIKNQAKTVGKREIAPWGSWQGSGSRELQSKQRRRIYRHAGQKPRSSTGSPNSSEPISSTSSTAEGNHTTTNPKAQGAKRPRGRIEGVSFLPRFPSPIRERSPRRGETLVL